MRPYNLERACKFQISLLQIHLKYFMNHRRLYLMKKCLWGKCLHLITNRKLNSVKSLTVVYVRTSIKCPIWAFQSSIWSVSKKMGSSGSTLALTSMEIPSSLPTTDKGLINSKSHLNFQVVMIYPTKTPISLYYTKWSVRPLCRAQLLPPLLINCLLSLKWNQHSRCINPNWSRFSKYKVSIRNKTLPSILMRMKALTNIPWRPRTPL